MKTAGQLVQTVSIIDTISQLASTPGHSGLDTLKSFSTSSGVGGYDLRGTEITSIRGMDLSTLPGTSLPSPPPLRNIQEKFRHSQHYFRKSIPSISPIRYNSVSMETSRPLPQPSTIHHSPRSFLSPDIRKPQTPPRNTPLTRNQGTRNLGSKVSQLPNSLITPAINTPSPQNKEITKGMTGPSCMNSTIRTPGLVEDRRKRFRKGGRCSKNTGGEDQTPYWIRELFLVVKRGNLEKLISKLEGTERGILRNIADYLGNNLVHACCQYGHAHILAWLANRLGSEMDSALCDENKQGLNPATLAIKYGRLDVLVWLVRNIRTVQEHLQSKDGERSLLHFAAKYGQDGLVSWLCEDMLEEGISLDQMDLGGNTPLHLAARHGRTKASSTLLSFGSSINMKNDMGLKPSDCARIRSEESTEEFLLMFETSLGITRDLLGVNKTNEVLSQENLEIKSQFREVLNVSKKLAKEREDMSKDLTRLKDRIQEIHSSILGDMKNLVPSANSVELERTNDSLKSLEQKIEEQRTQFCSASLADLEHRIMIAEDGAKKIKHQPVLNLETSYCQRHFRDRLEEIRASSGSLLVPASNLSSEPSLGSEEEEEEQEEEQENNGEESQDLEDISEDLDFYEAMKTPTNMRNQRSKLATPSPQHTPTRPSNNKTKSETSLVETVYSSLGSPIYSAIGIPTDGSTAGRDDYNVQQDFIQMTLGLDYQTAKLTAAELVKSSSSNGGTKEDKRQSRDHLKKRLQELALTSDTGSASVIEVIEPDSSEEEEFKKSFSWSPIGDFSIHSRTDKSLLSNSQSIKSQPRELNAKSHGDRILAQTGKPTTRRPRGLGSSNSISQTSYSQNLESNSNKNWLQDQLKVEQTEDMTVKSGHSAAKSNMRLNGSTGSPNQFSGPKNGLMPSPDLLTCVRKENEDSDSRPENGEEEIFCDYDTEPSPELERPDSILSNRKKGFLKKLAISKWAGKKKMPKIEHDHTEVDTIPIRGMDISLKKSMDDLDSQDEPRNFESGVSRPGIQDSVTRIEVGQGFQGSDTLIVPADELDSHVTKSLSPGSRKSLYSGYIRPDFNMAKSDDSGIIATSRPDSSNLPVRKSFSSSSDHSSQGSPSESENVLAPKRRIGENGLDVLSGEGPSVSRIREVGNHTTIVISAADNVTTKNRDGEQNNNLPVKPSNARRGIKTEKAWYDVSDEESDMIVPDHLTNIISVRGSSDEDLF